MNAVNFTKEEVYSICLSTLNSKIDFLNQSLIELKEAMAKDTKSSAGDKHETSRAMVQIEQEKLLHQLQEFEMQKEQLLKLDISGSSGIIKNGSLVETDHALFFIGVSLGKLKIRDRELMAISGQSPIGRIFIGLKPGSSVSFNEKTYRIIQVY